ncbi:MAG: FeoB-associated Cys-rich membrane protein [Clostridiales bacterium]|nr:FeoB-associated Cys-rich membrane protein [Clostridiales bacterium]
MGFLDYVIVVGLAALAAAAIVSGIRRKKRGGGCCPGCSRCSSCCEPESRGPACKM